MKMMSILCLMIILHSGVGNPMSGEECPEGRTGTRCEFCSDGYYGDPLGLEQNDKNYGGVSFYGTNFYGVRECQKCECNNNVDEHAIGNCDRFTGQCLKCIFDTAGWRCDRCKGGFHGDALAPNQIGEEQNCQPCNCYPKGTYALYYTDPLVRCDYRTGRCPCKRHVVGDNCDRCADGYFNIDSGKGCEPCNCDHAGSYNWTCNAFSGECDCRPGITGKRCDQCEPNHYSLNGWMDHCTPCNCDPSGSVHLQCDRSTGQCLCKDKVGGSRQCDQCQPGYWNFPNCQQCKCNGHADSCDPSNGQCINCTGNTQGVLCDQCLVGYYGHPELGPDYVPCRENVKKP